MKPRTQKFTVFGFLLFALVTAGCQSGKFTHWISPQISGRVLAADTHQPLVDAKVQRAELQKFEPFGPPKGGQVLMQSSGVQTDADGRFVLPGESVFAVFRQPGWWSVPVLFSCSGYQTFQTNYTGTNVIGHSAAGVPEVNAGDVLLQPATR
ncbi:MAG: hypothetical protein PHY43_11790 [Verrucomicrobiales bacterium]|nr:hypothetical protein [Verrucomicrobiales bacterium]